MPRRHPPSLGYYGVPVVVSPMPPSPWVRPKDLRLLQQDARQMASSYQRYVDAGPWWDDEDDLGFDDDLFGADEKEKKRPFKLLSDLFKRKPGENQSQAEKLIDAAAQTTSNVQQMQQAYQPPPPPASSWTPGKTAAVAVGSVAVLSLIGFGIYRVTR